MKITCGLVRPTAGEVQVCGAPAGSARRTAASATSPSSSASPTGRRPTSCSSSTSGSSARGGGAGERGELLELVGLDHVPTRRVGTMSKGMQQRLGIAQALVGAPRLLLLDEPTSALDPAGRRTVRALLERLRERGVGVLLNSHLLSEVELVCDRVAIIDGGEVVAAGTPAELSHAGGVEVETAAGTRVFADAARDDVPRIVRELVAAGEEVYGVRVLTLDARGRLPRGRRPRRADATERAASAARRRRSSRPASGRRRCSSPRFALRESLRRRVFLVIALLTLAFLVLYGLATWQAFKAEGDFGEATSTAGVDARVVVGATLAGLAMFAILFLGTILAVFLTLGAVRGRRGARAAAAAARAARCGGARCCSGAGSAPSRSARPTSIAVTLASFVLTDALGGWWPDRTLAPLAALGARRGDHRRARRWRAPSCSPRRRTGSPSSCSSAPG